MKLSRESIANILNKQKENRPLIHYISDITKASDFEVAIRCFGGRSIMAYGIEEVYEITTQSNGLLIGLGALDNSKILAMEKSLRVAKKKDIPVVLDLSGVNLSSYRRNTALSFLNRYNVDIVKGTNNEVDALIKSQKHHKNKNDNKCLYRDFARKNKVFLVVRSENFYITDGYSEFNINNGDFSLDERICGLDIFSGLLAVGLAICDSREEKLQSIIISTLTFAISEELIIEKMKKSEDELMLLKEWFYCQIRGTNEDIIDEYSKIVYEFKSKEISDSEKSSK